MSEFWYLATAYSKHPDGLQAAYDMALRATETLMRQGIPVFCPIVHTHPVAMLGNTDARDVDFWLKLDQPFIDTACGIIVLEDGGWEESKGVAHEIACFKAAGKPLIRMLADHRFVIDNYIAPCTFFAFAKVALADTRPSIFPHFEVNAPLPEGTAPAQPTGSKPTNPKDAVGSDKLPLHLWPSTATNLGCLALLDGMLKYGRSNFRAIGVRGSIYFDAALRHLNAWFEGEDLDPKSGLPHLAHALACIAIVVDAQAAGKLNDDRMFPGGSHTQTTDRTPHVARLKALYAGHPEPVHYTKSTL